MERELPIYKLNGINFHVEIKKAELIEVETPFLNIIKVNELVDAGTDGHIELAQGFTAHDTGRFQAGILLK